MIKELTDRERQILVLKANGNTAHQIGQLLGIKERSVSARLQNIYRKLGASDAAHAVAIGLSVGEIGVHQIIILHHAARRATPVTTHINSGPGWYEVINPRNATTCIALVYEDGSLYLPEGEDTLSQTEFAFAAARGNAHRLVRADEVQQDGAHQ